MKSNEIKKKKYKIIYLQREIYSSLCFPFSDIMVKYRFESSFSFSVYHLKLRLQAFLVECGRPPSITAARYLAARLGCNGLNVCQSEINRTSTECIRCYFEMSSESRLILLANELQKFSVFTVSL